MKKPFDFVRASKICMMVSACIIVVGLVMAFFPGIMLGIDFTGGTLLTLEMGKDFDMADINAALSENGIESTPLRSDNSVILRLKVDSDPEVENTKRANLLESLQVKYPEAAYANIERVGAVAGRDLIRSAVFSVLIAAVLITLYIWFRFEYVSGVAAIIGLLHDVLVMIAAVCILRIPVNSSFIAAMLTIVGYSINDTIVIYDRVRENVKTMTHSSRTDIVNRSVMETLPRTINTTLTTLFTITMVYVTGVSSIREFALPLIIGIVAGTYSSIFIACPVWAMWMDWNDARKHTAHAKVKKA